MTVGELERTMSNVEYLWWRELFAQEAAEEKAERQPKPIGGAR